MSKVVVLRFNFKSFEEPFQTFINNNYDVAITFDLLMEIGLECSLYTTPNYQYDFIYERVSFFYTNELGVCTIDPYLLDDIIQLILEINCIFDRQYASLIKRFKDKDYYTLDVSYQVGSSIDIVIEEA
ncbi:hypothetical protein [Endozoicomonas sp. ONNA1]|uniref:hypothetical protein n=1 Tax=Endozoicomonas sp. ONNA1 TaxID=2828740 RepID=UPI0021478146|nr:hypothetical protein [Endozoicomonas sp. ONNA1]